ncbi:MAG TPA: oligosaccharide flippase family protein [Bacteroidia bacterium]
MGIIEKQATKNAIYSYFGAGLGFLTLIWSSHLLSPDENGLTRILISISALFSQFAGLGFNASTVRFFPYFRNKDKGHHGYLFYGIIVTLLGFFLCWITFYFLKDKVVENNIEKSKLFVDYLFYLMPLTLFTLFFNLFDYYLRACYSSVIGSSSKDFIQRMLILLTLFLYFTKTIDFNLFIFLYVAALCIPTLILLFYIIKLDEWHIKPVRGFVSKELRAEMIKLSLFSILAGSAGLLISNIDIIMVNQKLGLKQTGIYAIAFYFGTIISIPARSLQRIAMSIVSEAFKTNDLAKIKELYQKSCNTQLAIGILLFIGIWSNIDNIMAILPEEYAEGKLVILFVSAGYLVDMSTGMNYIIMITSKYYRYDGYFMILILLLTVLANHFLIPVYGITGSAIATALTISLYNVMRWLFLYLKFDMQPYDLNNLKTILIAAVAFLPGYFIPFMHDLYLDIIIRSGIVGGVFILLILKLEAAPELNVKIRKNLKRFSINL